MTARLPDFLVVGGMRCGSTTLHKILKEHQQLYLPEQKELHFFDGYNPSLLDDLNAYRQLFSQANATQLCGEVTPDYLTTPQAFENISATFDNLKVIMILREPVARACSHFKLSCASGFEVLPFAQAINTETLRLTNRDKIADIFHSYVERSLYFPQIKKFADRFGKENTHVVFLEELIKQPEVTLSKVWEFLGVDSFDEGFDVAKLVQPSNESNGLLMAKKSILRRVSLRFLASIGIHSGKQPQMISENDKAQLQGLFKQSNEQLSELIGRELPWEKNATNV